MGTTSEQTAPEPQNESAPASDERTMRIGEVAELTGTTPRTIRYYEEIGLLAGGAERALGKHRCYSPADVERIQQIVKLKELLGVTLEQLSQLLEAESARAGLRREFHETDDPVRQRQLLEQSQAHIEHQLELVRSRLDELTKLERELGERAAYVAEKLEVLAGVLPEGSTPANTQ